MSASQRLIAQYLGSDIAIAVDMQHGSGPPSPVDQVEHSHDFTELILIHGGHGLHRVDGRDYAVSSGNVFVMQGMKSHAYVQRHDLYYAHVKFSPQRLYLPFDFLKKLPGYHALFVLEPNRRGRGRFRGFMKLSQARLDEAMALVRRIHGELLERKPGHEAVALALLIELMVFLSREYSQSDAETAQALLRVGDIIGKIEQEYHKEWQLKDMCHAAHMSKSNLLMVFREATGMTPIEYLIHARLRQAMRLLRNTDQTITEIAAAVGFPDSNYFARQFRKVHLVSPSDYRKNATN